MNAQPFRAFHGDPAVKDKYLGRVRAHAADTLALELLTHGHVRVYPASGNVWSARRRRLLGCKNPRGYLVATLHFGGERQQAKLHRIVWMAVHGPLSRDLVIDHINGVKDDNRIVNLRAVDNATNVRNRRSYRADGNPAARLTWERVKEIRSLHPQHSYADIAIKFDVSKSLIAQIVRGEAWA